MRPPWAPPLPGTLDVIIDVGMAFGTGSHASTRQCLAVLSALPPSSLLDAGTGTGVLALAAMRLGFAPVFAFDSDPDALVIAEENAAPQRSVAACCSAPTPPTRRSSCRTPTWWSPTSPRSRSCALGRRYAAALAAGEEHPRLVIAAGLIDEQLPAVLAAFAGYRRRESASEGEWHCAVLEAPASGEATAPDEAIALGDATASGEPRAPGEALPEVTGP